MPDLSFKEESAESLRRERIGAPGGARGTLSWNNLTLDVVKSSNTHYLIGNTPDPEWEIIAQMENITIEVMDRWTALPSGDHEVIKPFDEGRR